MTSKPSSRDRIVATGARLFQRQGYHGTGLIEILEVSGAPKGSFYHHFPQGKEQLAEAAMTLASDAVLVMIEAAFQDAATFSDGATRMTTNVADWFERSGFAEGCPVTSVMLETVPGSDRLKSASQLVFQSWMDRIETHAVRLGDADSAGVLATRLLVALEGAWILARAERSRRAFDVAAGMFAELNSR